MDNSPVTKRFVSKIFLEFLVSIMWDKYDRGGYIFIWRIVYMLQRYLFTCYFFNKNTEFGKINEYFGPKLSKRVKKKIFPFEVNFFHPRHKKTFPSSTPEERYSWKYKPLMICKRRLDVYLKRYLENFNKRLLRIPKKSLICD